MEFIRIRNSDVNEQSVVHEGHEIGSVWQGWFRLGGEGWTNSLCGTSGFPTRKEAARDLLRRYRDINEV